MREVRARLEKSMRSNRGKRGVNSLKLEMKVTTLTALKKRGIVYVGDLRHATDELLDQVLDELFTLETPPMPVAWANLEELIQDVRAYGRGCPHLRSCYTGPVSAKAAERLRRVRAPSCDCTSDGSADVASPSHRLPFTSGGRGESSALPAHGQGVGGAQNVAVQCGRPRGTLLGHQGRLSVPLNRSIFFARRSAGREEPSCMYSNQAQAKVCPAVDPALPLPCLRPRSPIPRIWLMAYT